MQKIAIAKYTQAKTYKRLLQWKTPRQRYHKKILQEDNKKDVQEIVVEEATKTKTYRRLRRGRHRTKIMTLKQKYIQDCVEENIVPRQQHRTEMITPHQNDDTETKTCRRLHRERHRTQMTTLRQKHISR